jgi:hypothetical protein
MAAGPLFRAARGALLAVSIAWTALPGTASAETPAADTTATITTALPHAEAPALHAAPLVGDLRIDGSLDESAWAAGTPADRFTQREPKEGQPATERTEVRVLIGDRALYVGARLYDREPQKIQRRLVRRDEELESDFVAILLDPHHDHVTGVVFRVAASGSINDETIATSGDRDRSWDPVWHCHTAIDSLGWVAEMEIPLSQLHFDASAAATWGIQIRRYIHRKQELSEFSFTPLKERDGVDRFGHLTDLGQLRAPRLLELLPYARSRTEFTRVEPGNPFRDGSDQFWGAGGDLRYGLSSNMTLNATVNPDFGEVEVDPAVVNLTASETFYPERRPFFVEGADVFRFGDMRSYNNFNTTIPFHGRRIGREPQRSLDDEGYAFTDVPLRTTITAAAKVTGKTSSGWTLGVLDAFTPREMARTQDALGVKGTTPVEPATNYFVGRARREYRAGNTLVGTIFTSTNRDLKDPELETILRSDAFTGGLDLNHYWGSRHWSVDAMLLGSSVRGGTEVMASTQRSNPRYFQRPDATHVEFDPNRTHLEGAAGLLSVNKIAGKHGLGSITYQDWSPGFEINDLGFQNAADFRALSTLALYKEDKPGKVFRSWDTFVFTNWAWNYGGDRTYVQYSGVVEGTWTNYWYGSLRGEWYPGNIDDKLTRGGPLSAIPPGAAVRASVTTDPRRFYTLNLNGATSWDDAGGHVHSASAALTVRPVSACRILFSPTFRKVRDMAQYIQTESDTTATETYGGRYVFGTLKQTEVSLDTRVDWTFTPRLSLQLFVQPLISSGEYADIKELKRPSRYEFNVYGEGAGTIARDASGDYTVDPDGSGAATAFTVSNPDFNFRSFRGNAVLRWEYRPGSALYLVWQQAREETESFGDFDFSRDFDGLFEIDPTNVIVVKATYWLPL